MLARVHRHALLHEPHTPASIVRAANAAHGEGRSCCLRRGVVHNLEGPGGGLLESHEARDSAVLRWRHDSATSLSIGED